jgi:hypothetical protein
MLRKIFGPKGDEVTGQWKIIHNEVLYDSVLLTKYYSDDQIKKNEMGGVRGMYGGQEKCIQGFGGET